MDNKLSELSNPAWIVGQQEIADFMRGDEALLVRGYDPECTEPALRMYSQEYVSALLSRIEELEWRELNSTELKELLTWHPTEKSAATDPILWAAMRNKINLTRVRVASDEAMKEQSNG
ncbi:hypothetical protein ACUNF7_09015 [Serratia sp. IR-2025]